MPINILTQRFKIIAARLLNKGQMTYRCCTPRDSPVVSGDVGRGFRVRRLSTSSSLSSVFFSRRSLSTASNYFAFVLHSLFHVSLHTVLSSPCLSSSPPFPIYFTDICSLCQFSILHSFYMTSPFLPTPNQFLLKTFLHSNQHVTRLLHVIAT